jgi:hypothetical protein
MNTAGAFERRRCDRGEARHQMPLKCQLLPLRLLLPTGESSSRASDEIKYS